MKYNFYLTLGLIFTFLSCNLNRNDSIKDFVRESGLVSIDSSKYVSQKIFIEKFDTIPVDFGYTIFQELIEPIPVESSRFKQIWNWEVDSIRHVLARKNDVRLDPKNKLSSETYFFIIEFLTPDSLPIATTIFIDFEKEIMGTYMFPLDSLKSVHYNNDITKVAGLEEKLRIH